MQKWEEGSYFAHKYPEGYSLMENYINVAKNLVKFIETDDKLSDESRDRLLKELEDKLFVNKKLNISQELRKELGKLWHQGSLVRLLKDSDPYAALAKYFSHLPQQLLWKVDYAWKSYQESVKVWRLNPDLFLDGKRPNIPYYGLKYNEFNLSFTGHDLIRQKVIVDHFNNTKRKSIVKIKNLGYKERGFTAELLLPKKFLDIFPKDDLFPPIRTRIELNNIVEIRIVPKRSCYEVQIVYGKKLISKKLDLDKIASVDLGLNEMMAITTNLGLEPLLVKGTIVKSANQLMNKLIADLQSAHTIGKTIKKGDILPESMEMARIRKKRMNRIDDQFHKASRFLINYCVDHEIGRIVIGYNKNWKQGIELLKKVKQNFVFVSFDRLVQKIEYKAELVGIKVVRIPENYTSKASALDRDPIPDYDPEKSKLQSFRGMRGSPMKGLQKKSLINVKGEKKYYKARGLYKTTSGKYIHSDVNGSFKIGRKAFPELYKKKTERQMLMSPRSVNLNPVII